jgi:tRNA pseudouridine55 synthase
VIGFVVVDKEAGWTSHDVVARCRGILQERRVGHAGTLDPSATGVLVLGVGRATRLLRYVSGADKEYRGEIVLGTTTTTLDAEGEVVERFDMSGVTLDDAVAAASALTGDIDQMVPMVSAVKVGGRRLHRLAREGVDVERPVRRVRVERFAVADGPEPGTLVIDVHCSAGTYVRVLAAELGAALGGGAHLRHLRRIRAGSFRVEEAVTLDELAAAVAAGDDSALRPPLAALDMQRADVDGDVLAAVRFGRPLDRSAIDAGGPGPFALVGPDGALVAVYEDGGDGRTRAAVVLVPA